MKILFLNYEYPPLGGGAANATEYILREYSEVSDVQVELVTSSVDQEYHREQVGENIIIHRLPIGKKGANLHHQSQKELLTYSWKAYWFSRKLLKEDRFDVAHAFFAVPCGVLLWALWHEFHVPYIVSLRGADVPGYSERFMALYAPLRPLVRQVWGKAHSVIANSQGLKELALKTDSHQPIGVIYNGVDTKQFVPATEKNVSPLKVLCVSRLTPRKGIRYLLRAMAILKEKHGGNAVRLFVAGEGDEKEALIEESKNLQVSGMVEFLGRVEHDALPDRYRQADIFVLPSLNEGMSNTMLEAIASGLPIVATDTGGTRELMKDGENGYMIAMKSPEDIAEKLSVFIQKPELVQEMGAKSRQVAEAMSWKKVAEQYRDLYRLAAEKH